MRVVGFDTEGALFRRGLLVPPLTCASFYDTSTKQGWLFDRRDTRNRLESYLRDDEALLVAHHAPHDISSTIQEFPELKPLWFRKLDLGLVEDTLANEQLVDIAEGHFRWEVDEETDEYIGKKKYGLGNLFPGLEKDEFRYGYGPMRDVPIERYSSGQKHYPILDAQKAGELWWDQCRRYGGRVIDAAPQARAGAALHLMSAWGMRTDEESVLSLQRQLITLTSQLRDELMLQGFIDPKKGSKNMAYIRSAVEHAARVGGYDILMTKGGDNPDPSLRKPQISIASDVLKIAAQFVPVLQTLVRYQENEKLLTTYLPALLEGIHCPINASFNVLVETGRTSCSKPNLQNLPRGKKDPLDLSHFVRECFIPRRGNVFCSTDYDSLEIRTLAQALKDLVGGTTFIREYQRDPNFDPHTRLAARMLGISYETAMERKAKKDQIVLDRRQMSKAGNFGYPGGMGALKMLSYAFKSYGVKMSLAESKQLKNFFLAACPEMQVYFAIAAQITAGSGEHGIGKVASLRSGRVRGGLRYTDCNNGWFQSLAADGAKAALWEVTKACHLDTYNPLYGCRPVCFVHDEIICEMPEEQAPEAAVEMERIMCQTMRRYTPDVPITASPALMRQWLKGADAVYGPSGRLMVYEPKKKAA